MQTNKIISNLHYNLQTVLCFGTITIFLIWNLGKGNYYIILHNLKLIVIGLIIYSLFVDTKQARLKLDWWIYIALFGVMAFLSTHASHDYLISSIKISLDFYIVAFCFLVYVIFFEQLPRMVMPILLIVVLAFLLISVPTTVSELIFQIPVENKEHWLKGQELTASFEFTYYRHIRHFSYHAFIASCCAFILLKYCGPNVFLKSIAIVMLAICFFSMLLAYGRGSFIAFAVFLMIDAWLEVGPLKALKQASIAALVSLGFYFLIYFTSIGIIPEFLFSSFLRGDIANPQELAESVNVLSSGRLEMWVYSIEQALESPVFGHGSGSAHWLFKGTNHAYAGQPHNVVVQFIMDFGFLGGAVLCFLAAKMLVRLSVKFNVSSRDELLRRSLFAFVLAYSIFSFSDGLFFHPLPMMNFAVVLTLLLALHSSIEATYQKSGGTIPE